MRLLFLTLIISGCGGTYHVSSDPIQVNHTIDINFEEVALYCQEVCRNSYYSECESECFTNTVNSIMAGINL